MSKIAVILKSHLIRITVKRIQCKTFRMLLFMIRHWSLLWNLVRIKHISIKTKSDQTEILNIILTLISILTGNPNSSS